MRILLLTHWFDPEPTFKGLSFAQELRRQGHEIEVLAGFPNHPDGEIRPDCKARLFQWEMIDGISILRVPLYLGHDQPKLGRVLNYTSFAATASTGILFLKRPDELYVCHPAATVGLAAIVLKASKGVPFVYDMQNLWPDALVATGRMERSAVLSAIYGWMNRIYKSAAHVLLLSEGFKDRSLERGVPYEVITIIPNWTNEQQIKLSAPNVFLVKGRGLADKFKIVFADTIGKAQALDTVLDAARILLVSTPQVHFIFVGGGVEVERLQASAETLPNVSFLPRRPPNEIGEVLSIADVLLVHLKDDPLFSITIPSRTQACLMAGKPILMGVRGDAASMVGAAKAEHAFEPENVESLAEAVERIRALGQGTLRTMGESGQAYYREHLSVRLGVQRFYKCGGHA